jgi:hypothetical protein
MYFTRVELSYVQAINSLAGTTFGVNGSSANQFRAMLEAGILY